jgi:hypothetical protein
MSNVQFCKATEIVPSREKVCTVFTNGLSPRLVALGSAPAITDRDLAVYALVVHAR